MTNTKILLVLSAIQKVQLDQSAAAAGTTASNLIRDTLVAQGIISPANIKHGGDRRSISQKINDTRFNVDNVQSITSSPHFLRFVDIIALSQQSQWRKTNPLAVAQYGPAWDRLRTNKTPADKIDADVLTIISTMREHDPATEWDADDALWLVDALTNQPKLVRSLMLAHSLAK